MLVTLTPDCHSPATIVPDDRGKVTTPMPMTKAIISDMAYASSIFKLGGWDGSLLLPPFHSVVGSQRLFPKDTAVPWGCLTSNLLFQYLEPPLACTRVWFLVFDHEISVVFCRDVSIVLE